MNSSSDRSLLFGILAWQNGFIGVESLLSAIQVWLTDKSKPLGQVFVERGLLSADKRAVLEQLLDARIEQDGGDAGQSLAKLSSSLPFAGELAELHDVELDVSLTKLPATVLHAAPAESLLSSRESRQRRASAMHDQQWLDVVDPICDRFESAWREHFVGWPPSAVSESASPTSEPQSGKSAQPTPRLEDFLSDVPSDQQPVLFRELLILEVQWLRKNGQVPDPKSYQQRFPNWSHIVADAFDLANGRYLVPDKPFDKGNLGEVYEARDLELNRNVAFKTVQPKQDNDLTRKRLVVEGEITGGLEHPGIVPVYGLGHFRGGRPFYVMRFIKGENLQKAIRRFHGTLRSNDPLAATVLEKDANAREPNVSEPNVAELVRVRTEVSRLRLRTATHTKSSVFETKRLEFRELLGRFVDVCQALAYAHSRRVLHRDLKPGNIMLGKYGETLVVDWGLAKALGKNDADESIPFDPQLATDVPLIPSSGSDQHLTIGVEPGRARHTGLHEPRTSRWKAGRTGTSHRHLQLGSHAV